MLSIRDLYATLAAFLVLATMASAQVPQPGYVLVDDMYLPESVVFGDSAFTATSWTANQVPYAFNANVSATNQAIAIKAMAELTATAFINFVPHSNQANWVVFNNSNVNNSQVGMVGGGQTINITSWGSKFVVVHELMHALGYVHEQSRPDRDNFVTINTGNITSGLEYNFSIVNGATQATGYDFLSIMHYGRTAFSSNTLDTITCKPAYLAYQTQIGNRLFMTTADVTGLQNRYFQPLGPSLTLISPSSVTTATGGFTLHVYGARFFEGSLTGAGVIGTRITWNGSQLPTTYVDSGHVTAQIPATYTSQPGIRQIGIINPSPAGGATLNTLPLSVVCSSGLLGLSQNVPVTVYNGCQQFSINPAYNTTDVVAVSSPADWDITMGTGSAAAGGNTCDFLVGNGFLGAGTITPTNGNITLYAGVNPATLEYVTSSALNTGSPTIASMPAGAIVSAFHFSAAAVSYRRLDVAGPSNLSWKLIWSGNGFGWRSSTSSNVVAQGQCGAGPVAGIGIVPSVYTLVVYSNGGPLAAPANFTINEGFDFTPVPLTSSNAIVTVAQGPYSFQPFSISPLNNHWNVVGVSSPTDWDIQIGPAVSQYGGNWTDYVLANGHLGGINPLIGSTSPYQYPGSSGYLQFAPTATMPSFPGSTYSYTPMLLCFEFNVTVPGSYDLSVGGGAGWAWDLHGPGVGSTWRRRQDALSQSNAANGLPITMNGLTAGWHAVVLRHDGGPTSLISPSISATYASLQTSTVTALAPASAPANSGTFSMSVYGTDFTASSQVLWDGGGLLTSFVSDTELAALVDNSLIPAMGSANVSVATPGAGTSNSVAFSIETPVPVMGSITPTQGNTGDPSFTLTVYGSDFTPASEVHWAGVGVPTSFVNSGQLDALIDASLLLAQVYQPVTVFTPAPGGGESATAYFLVLDPVIFSLTPPSMSAVAPASAPFPATVSGAYFTPFSTVYANGVALPTTFTDSNTLDVTIDPTTVEQATVSGAIGIVVVNTPVSTSNLMPLVIDGGGNIGLIRTQPVAPQPGEVFTGWVEGGVPFSPLLMIADFGNPIPVAGFPDPTANFVLSVTEGAGTAGPWLTLVDGVGLFGPPDGSAFDGAGIFQIPGITQPSPPLGIDVVLQVAYVDPNAVYGFTMSWALYKMHI